MSAIKRTTAGILFPACVLILSGCRDKNSAGTDPAVELKTTTVTLAGATGSEQNVSFGATVDWTAALTDPKAAEWCAVTPTRGKAGSELKLTVRSLRTNDTDGERTAEIVVTAGTASGKVTVTQVKQGVLAVNPARFDVPGIGATIDATVQQNVEYSVVIPDSVASWILPADGSKAVVDRLSFEVKPNETPHVREAVVLLRDLHSELKGEIAIRQRSAYVPEITDGWDIYGGGGYRYGPSIMIHDDGTIDAWFAAPGGQYGDNVLLYENKGQNTPVRLGAAGSSVGQRFTADRPFYAAGAICVNWNGQPCGLRLSLYRWDTSYDRTVASTPVARQSFTNYADGGFVHVTASEGKFPAGTYLWVMDEGTTEHSGLWKHPGVVTGVTNYQNGQAVDFSLAGQYMLEYSGGSTFWDQASYQRSEDGGINWSQEKMVLLPTEFSSDHFSVCDPGVARWGGYSYAGYTSTENLNMVENHVYIARSQSPEGPWEKWNGTGWTTGTDVQPMIRYTDDPTAFGAGEPSIVVLDGTIYFYYSWNDSGTGIKTRLATADATDPLWPAHLDFHGVVIDKSAIAGSDHCDVKYREDIGKFQAVHTASRMSADSYIVLWQSDDGIRFEKIAELRDGLQPYLHNCGWSGDELGHIKPGVQQYIAYAYGTDWGNWKTRWSRVDF